MLDFDRVGVSYTPVTAMDHADQFFAISLFYLSYTLLKACTNKQKGLQWLRLVIERSGANVFECSSKIAMHACL